MDTTILHGGVHKLSHAMVEWAGVLGKCKGSKKTADTGVAAGSDKMISIY